MNYEQKYNEVLQKAKEEYIRLGELGNESMKRSFEIIFPELRESEDERIRKFLVEILSHGTWRKEWPFEPNEVVAYLEKQKEQKHPNGCFTCDEYKKGYEAGRSNGFTAGYNKAMKEQKPAEWSEEDSYMFSRIIYDVRARKDYYEDVGNEVCVEECEKEIDWLENRLKSLRPSWKLSEEEIRTTQKL